MVSTLDAAGRGEGAVALEDRGDADLGFESCSKRRKRRGEVSEQETRRRSERGMGLAVDVLGVVAEKLSGGLKWGRGG